jgi:hypothetical protein
MQKSIEVEGRKYQILSILKVLQPFWKLPNAVKQLVFCSQNWKISPMAITYCICILKVSLVELKVWCEVWCLKLYIYYFTLEFEIYNHGRWYKNDVSISWEIWSPSRRREAPCEGTNSPRLFTPGEREALAKSKVHQWARAPLTNDGEWVVILTDLKNMADRDG